MVTYCIGSARQKREYFNSMRGAIVLDNVEVLFCASENGRNYFAYGAVPFAAFTVSQYLNYRRALVGGEIETCMLKTFGLSPNKRLGGLTAAQMRCVAFLEKTCGRTDAPVVINLDGSKYTRKNFKTLARLLAFCPDAYVCVTDARYVKHERRAFKMLAFGKPVGRVRPKFYAAKILAKQLGAYRVAVM